MSGGLGALWEQPLEAWERTVSLNEWKWTLDLLSLAKALLHDETSNNLWVPHSLRKRTVTYRGQRVALEPGQERCPCHLLEVLQSQCWGVLWKSHLLLCRQASCLLWDPAVLPAVSFLQAEHYLG